MAWATCLLFVPFHKWLSLFPAGLITLIVLYLIDSTLILLNAFSYRYANPILSDLPVLYWLSGFPEGMLLVYYFPKKKHLHFPYIVLAAVVFLGMELIMLLLKYISYHNWSPVFSLFLNMGGFIDVIFLSQWIKNIQQKNP